jgi:hypothetical protein
VTVTGTIGCLCGGAGALWIIAVTGAASV